MSWLAFLLTACCVTIGLFAVGNLIVGLVMVWGYLRGTRCTDRDDFSAALAMVFFGAPLCFALSVLCWWGSGQLTSSTPPSQNQPRQL